MTAESPLLSQPVPEVFMLVRVPDYYDQFRCLAGACPHSCCTQWEVVIDEDTAARYAAVEGELGERLRAALTQDDDGDLCFPLNGGRCPFLDGENLCEIHRRLGEEATSVTCQSHPRFIEEYEELKEITLAASCPAANELLLGEQRPLRFVVTEEGELPADLLPLYALRERALEGLCDRALPLKVRLKWLLALAVQAQALLDEGEEEALLELAQAEPGEVEWETEESEGLFPDALEALAELEVLEEDWVELLAA
jgi:lysine-N-methylase